jgi:hypothetical protein
MMGDTYQLLLLLVAVVGAAGGAVAAGWAMYARLRERMAILETRFSDLAERLDRVRWPKWPPN